MNTLPWRTWRYLFRRYLEVLLPLLAVGLVLGASLELAERGGHLSLERILTQLQRQLPWLMLYLLPLSALFASALTQGRLEREGVLMVLRSTGRSPRILVLPLLAGGLGLGSLAYAVSNHWLASQPADALSLPVQLTAEKPSGRWLVEKSVEGSVRATWVQLPDANGCFHGVTQLVLDGTGENRLVESPLMCPSSGAAQGEAQGWFLQNGHPPTHLPAATLDMPAQPLEAFRHDSPFALTLTELVERLEILDRMGQNTGVLLLVLLVRLLVPLSCLQLTLLGAGLRPRGSRPHALQSLLFQSTFLGLLYLFSTLFPLLLLLRGMVGPLPALAIQLLWFLAGIRQLWKLGTLT